MNKCINPELGGMLHAYELNQLPDDKKEIFEQHLLDCGFCFDEVRKFEKVSDLIIGERDVRETIKGVVAEETRKAGSSFWQKTLELLWPQTRFVLKPAVAYFLILLMAYPAYLGIRKARENEIRQVMPLNLVPNRASSASIERSDKDILLTFVFSGADPEGTYTVEIESAGGEIIYLNKNFQGFDKYGAGRLILPATKVTKGEYKLRIIDQKGAENGMQQYTFNVN